MSESILITGANGFVGNHLRAELGDAALAAESDVRDLEALRREVRAARPSAVVHLAALSSAGESWAEPAETWLVNVIGTVNVLEAVREEAEGARVLLVSTGEVYGRAEEGPTAEAGRIAPVSPYGASKAAAELAGAVGGLDVVVARAFQHEGPGRDERFAVGSWAAQIARAEGAGGGALKVGDLSPRRDITDVRDVCRAYRLLLDAKVPAGTYNIASGKTVAMQEVAEQLVALAGAPVTIEVDPERMRPVDIPVVWGDASKLAAATGWEPKIPLDETLRDALAAAREAVAQELAKT